MKRRKYPAWPFMLGLCISVPLTDSANASSVPTKIAPAQVEQRSGGTPAAAPESVPLPESVRLAAPLENGEAIGRRPEIRVEFATAVDPSSILVIVDGADVTQLATISADKVIYQPYMVLPAGGHNIQVSAKAVDGTALNKSFSFNSRHGETFKEAASTNEVSATYEAALARLRNTATNPTHKLEANLRSDTKLKGDNLAFGFNTNVRYFDQSLPVMSPLRKGVDMVNYLMTIGYERDKIKAQANVGDLIVNETTYTVSNLARRGGMLALEYDTTYLHLFNVRSDQVYGLRDSVAPQFNTTKDIRGVAGGVKLFENRVEAKITHAIGGETATGFNTVGDPGGKKGDVTGALLTTDFFENRLRTELEGAWSSFDADTSDAVSKSGGQAFRAKINGFLQPANYEVQYERVSANFTSIGNLGGVVKDKETITARGGATIGPHAFTVSGLRQYDNLNLDPTRNRSTGYQGTFDYNCTIFQEFPFGINYQKGATHSSHEAAISGVKLPSGLQSDSVGGKISYNATPFTLTAMSSFARQNDTEASNNDSTLLTYSLAPVYSTPTFSLTTNLMLTQNKNHTTNDRTDNYTANVDIRSRFFADRLSVETGATWSQNTNTSKTTDSWNVMANSRIGYNLPQLFGGFMKPSIALRGTYNHTSDRISKTNRDEASLFLVLATAMPFVF